MLNASFLSLYGSLKITLHFQGRFILSAHHIGMRYENLSVSRPDMPQVFMPCQAGDLTTQITN